ncbi:hypothetical protein BW730_13920 [Tessaracoccus aquimaris]|uniref:IclR family transcriptional regulator n=1 Tax=Tessaracoccus aquimaris TaxID=1332264 RepID=A0A1Q2CQY5_9ACTN|nr:IclR family transcriptional regulator [Tessaracoccus aquimaris]AQP48440.1 hypothetical protein BW730_13920 [Tessaracoccus aquimaris]
MQDAPDTEVKAGRRGPEGLRALDRATSILYTLAAHPDGMSLADLSRETGLTMPTVHRMLAALRTKELVRETSGGLHALGLGTLVLAGAFLDGVELRREATAHLASLNASTNETVHLGTLASPHMVYIDKIDSSHPVRMFSQVGAVMPAVRTAMGKAILANSSDETVERVLEDSVRQLGSGLDADQFREELGRDRERGYSTDLEENERGICCVGAPIFDSTGRAVAAISVSTPTERFDFERIDALGAAVRGAAQEISRGLGHLTADEARRIRDIAVRE